MKCLSASLRLYVLRGWKCGCLSSTRSLGSSRGCSSRTKTFTEEQLLQVGMCWRVMFT